MKERGPEITYFKLNIGSQEGKNISYKTKMHEIFKHTFSGEAMSETTPVTAFVA